MQYRVNHALAENDGLACDEAHGLDELVAVHLPVREQAQYEKLGNSAHERRIRLGHCCSATQLNAFDYTFSFQVSQRGRVSC